MYVAKLGNQVSSLDTVSHSTLHARWTARFNLPFIIIIIIIYSLTIVGNSAPPSDKTRYILHCCWPRIKIIMWVQYDTTMHQHACNVHPCYRARIKLSHWTEEEELSFNVSYLKRMKLFCEIIK